MRHLMAERLIELSINSDRLMNAVDETFRRTPPRHLLSRAAAQQGAAIGLIKKSAQSIKIKRL
jgi:hypothetical protein